jgi:hypothetical protein
MKSGTDIFVAWDVDAVFYEAVGDPAKCKCAMVATGSGCVAAPCTGLETEQATFSRWRPARSPGSSPQQGPRPRERPGSVVVDKQRGARLTGVHHGHPVTPLESGSSHCGVTSQGSIANWSPCNGSAISSFVSIGSQRGGVRTLHRGLLLYSSCQNHQSRSGDRLTAFGPKEFGIAVSQF